VNGIPVAVAGKRRVAHNPGCAIQEKRLPGAPWLTVAGLITGAAFVISLPVLGGAGGKLGTLALGAATATWAVRTYLPRA
jgi:hypothetical protein